LFIEIKAAGYDGCYPSRSVLAAWIQELHPQARTRIVGRTGELTPAMRQTAVVELCMRQGSAEAVARDLGVSRPTLYDWKNRLLGHDAPGSMKRKKDSPPSTERAELEQQVEALRQDVRRLRLEQDLLKKANELLKKTWASTSDA